MSSRKSNSSGEALPSGRCGERTPLRSLENEVLSTPSRVKSQPLLSAGVVRTTKGDSVQSPSTDVTQASIDMTAVEAVCGLGDVTFKSFICPGGEVEITGPPVCAEDSIVLPRDQAMTNAGESDDTVTSDSLIVQLCSDHVEHPYYNPETKDASLVDIHAASLCDISNTAPASGDLDDKSVTQDFQAFEHDHCGDKDVTWKSFVYDGGEVEVSDLTRLQDETIPLPKAHPGEPLEDSSVISTDLSYCGQLLQVEHADHPYGGGNSVCVTTTFSENGLSDVTFKSFNCPGGEIEISDGTKLTDETAPLPADLTATCTESYNHGADPSMFTGDQDVQNGEAHVDHPYYNMENHPSSPNGNLPFTRESLSFSFHAVDEVKPTEVPGSQTARQEDIAFGSFISASSEGEELDESPPPSDDQAGICQAMDNNSVPTSSTQDHIQDNSEQFNSQMEKDVMVDADRSAISMSSVTGTPPKPLDDKSVNCPMRDASEKHSIHPEDSALPSPLNVMESSNCSHLAASAETPIAVEQTQEQVSQVSLSSGHHKSSEAKDSALGSSGNGPVLCNSTEKHFAENLPEAFKVLSECPAVVKALQFEILSPIVRRASLFALKAHTSRPVDQFLADSSALEDEKSLVSPVNVDPAGLWAEHLESPMPHPLFNSTALASKPRTDPVTEPLEDAAEKPCTVEKLVGDVPLIPEGPLQQQLRQMAEFLFLASGKMDPAAFSAPALPPAAVTVPLARATAESHSVCVGTTPMKRIDHSVNTSGQFERKRDFSVVDSCTLTDPLLWNLPPGSLECLPRAELEQRLRSSMIMVEALVQQLTAARTHGCVSAGPAPSDLREKLVQTDHTELNQTTMHRDLYLEALSRIGELELDGGSLQNVIQYMQNMRITLTSLSCDTDAALSNMQQMGDVARDDHQSLVSHYTQMKSLLEKTKETQAVMMQKVKDAFHQKDDMRTQMDEAFAAKEAAFSTMEQLRTHCATEMSELQRIVGSQQELLDSLKQTYPEQVALNQVYTETLNSASAVLSTTIEEQSSLMKELCTVRGFLQKTAPMLLKLNEKAAAALRERDAHISERDQAVEEREQIEEEWNRVNLNLQAAREQIADLNLQVTILTSEMGVLRQKLSERDEERSQLERKVTELSATVSSSLASYTFLEQALAAETTKLQQSWRDSQLAKERENELETVLARSQQSVCELRQALAQSDEQLSQLEIFSQSQAAQIHQLQDVCTQLSGVREMNEFLQVENDLAREQMAESERMLRANLQSLRERNIQCEDLKGELNQLQLDNRSLQQGLETTRSRASTTQLELREKLAQAVTEITLLHHTLRGLTNELHAALNDQKPEPLKDKGSQPVHGTERRHPSSSFVDSIMVALTAEKEEDGPPGSAPSDTPECETLSSETSAFTRVAAVTPKKSVNAAEGSEPEEEEQSSMTELFAGLGSTVTELISTLKVVRQRKDDQLDELHNTVRGLQGEQQAANGRHEAEASELKHQLERLSSLAERGNQALQQKALDERTMAKLMAEMQEAQEILNKHKTDNNELRKEVAELRRSLQQSKVESQFLRGELRKAGGQSANSAHLMEEKIQLLREVEKLKLSLQEVELARVKLLDRAKRHQIIHQTNQQKSENELQILNKMINKVRETLLSLPEVVDSCEQLQQLVEYIG